MPKLSAAEQRVIKILSETAPAPPRRKAIFGLASIAFVIGIAVGAVGAWSVVPTAPTTCGPPMTDTQRMILERLVDLVSTSQGIEESFVLSELRGALGGCGIDRLDSASFETARDWLVQRAGR